MGVAPPKVRAKGRPPGQLTLVARCLGDAPADAAAQRVPKAGSDGAAVQPAALRPRRGGRPVPGAVAWPGGHPASPRSARAHVAHVTHTTAQQAASNEVGPPAAAAAGSPQVHTTCISNALACLQAGAVAS